jgi:phosphoribosylformylglycinamidine synthase subunit PurL
VEVEKSLFKIIRKLIEQKLVVGVQPVGAQGIAGAVAEMAARGNSGATISTTDVPQRDNSLSPRDVLVSETWGRILICFSPENLEKVKSISNQLDVEFGILGEVTTDGMLSVIEKDLELAKVPVDYLGLAGKAPIYEPEFVADLVKPGSFHVDDLPEPDHYPKTTRRMMGSLNLVSKKWLSKKFSKTLRSEDLSIKYPSDASIIEIDQNGKALVATMDCNPRYMTGDPYQGARIAVAEAARNIVCAGGKPLAVSDCLNFGNPNDPKAYGAFVASVKGVADACKHFDLPVVSGNVSFYNQRSVEGQILPVTASPIIGMVGLLKDSAHHTTLSFRHKGDMIFLVGRSRNDINGSEYLRYIHGIGASLPPFFSMDEELELQKVVAGMIENQLVRSVHDVSNGGLFFTLLESSIPLEFGFDITTDAEIRKDAFLFGESQSRVIVSVSAEKQDMFVDYMMDMGFPFYALGHVTKGEVRIDDESYGFVDELKKAFEDKLKNWVEAKK